MQTQCEQKTTFKSELGYTIKTMQPLFLSRGMPYLILAGAIWLVWLFGAITQTPIRSLAVLMFDTLGAFILIRLSSKLPATLRPSVLGLGIALAFITLGDAILTYSLFAGIPRADSSFIRDPLYYTGSLVVVISALAFPFAMQRQGLYVQAQALTLVLGSVIFAVLLTVIVTFVTQTTIGNMAQSAFSQIVFQFVVYLLTALFGSQTVVLGRGRLANTLRQLSIVFLLVSLARIATIAVGGQYYGELIYDFLWCAGMSMAAWMMANRE
jgi:hypothetical protein